MDKSRIAELKVRVNFESFIELKDEELAELLDEVERLQKRIANYEMVVDVQSADNINSEWDFMGIEPGIEADND